jgi:pyruvate dehydrogenase E2 component (dihydrolipoamide acetyltransferase)
MAEFLMPKLGADMSAGKLISWRKKPGDPVIRGEIIADVETDKADIEVEVFTSGVIEKFLVSPGEKVPVGTPLAIIHEADGATLAEQAQLVTTCTASYSVASARGCGGAIRRRSWRRRWESI